MLTAFDSASRRTGLLRHESLPAGTGIIIAPSNAIHTFFMRFAIDVAFVTKDGKVVKLRAAVPPWRMAGALARLRGRRTAGRDVREDRNPPG